MVTRGHYGYKGGCHGKRRGYHDNKGGLPITMLPRGSNHDHKEGLTMVTR